MLQLINAIARTSPSGSAEPALPSGFAQADGAGVEAASRPFDLQMAVQGFAAAAVDAQALSSASIPPETAHVSEADAEQWLASVLGQQAVRIEARESPESARDERALDEDGEPVDVTEMLPGALLDPAQLPPREQPQPVDAARAAKTVVPGQTLSPGAEPVAASRASMAVDAAPGAALPLAIEGDAEVKVLERLPGTSAESDKATPGNATAAAPATAALAAERPLKLHAPQAQWGEQMLASLREHVDMQINQRIQNATIRLDPPELGSLEIFLSHESGRLSVQLSAANADVARLLQQTSERLRQELVGQNFVQVNVQVSADAQGGRQQQQARAQSWPGEETVAAASALPDAGEQGAAQSTSDVLVTV